MNNFDYKNMTPFKWFVLENFPFIENDFDAINNYHLFSKVVEYLNQTIDNMNLTGEQMENVTNAMTELQNYVNNYFDNLDVQEEINNKLDDMVRDGTLGNILDRLVEQANNEMREDLSLFESTINNQIGIINNKVDVATNATPLAVSSTSDMTDTTRIYVNTTDGKWYYYDGDSWEIGGTYQSTGIAEDAITIFNLDDMLKENFNKEYEPIEYTANLQGYVKISGTTIAIENDEKYVHAVVNLDNNTTYEFAGNNFYVTCALVITDSEDTVIYSTRSQSGTGTGRTPVSLRFKTNQSGLKAYISFPAQSTTDNFATMFWKNVNTLIKLNNISQNYKENTLEPIQSSSQLFVKNSSTVNNQPILETTEDTKLDIYKINKGVKYNIVSANLWLIAGIAITDNSYKVTYISSSSYHSSIENLNYTFTAPNDGYVILSYDETRFTPTIKILNALNKTSNKYSDKIWCAMGDSLTDAGTLDGDDNYVDFVSQDLGIIAVNYGHGGSGYKARSANNQAFYQIASTLSNPDVITIFGSFNDTFSTLTTYGFGTIDDDTTDTIFGSVNVTLDTLIENYPDAVIGIIIPTPWEDRNNFDATSENKEKANTYVNGLKQICEKRSIPYLDLYTKSNLYPWDSTFKASYFLNGDGTHPNSDGNKKFSSQVVEFIKQILY